MYAKMSTILPIYDASLLKYDSKHCQIAPFPLAAKGGLRKNSMKLFRKYLAFYSHIMYHIT